MDLNDLLMDVVQAAIEDLGHVNVIIAGRSGVGKSTLINAIFQGDFAKVGQGKPVTPNIQEITKEGIPLTIFDTRGLEMNEFSSTLEKVEILVSERCRNTDPNKHIHLAWICIQEDLRRVEEAEIMLQNMLAKYVPIITIITKARSDNGFKNEVAKLLPKSKNIVRVRAISEIFDEGYKLPTMGLKDLVQASLEGIPEGKKRAFCAVQKADIDSKIEQSHKIVATAATTAATAALSPLPMTDSVALAMIQVGMIANISSVFGMNLSLSTLSTIISSAIGVTGAGFAGRAIVASVFKFFPGIGTATGVAIAASTASAITVALGEAYISVLASIYLNNPGTVPEARDIAQKFKEKLLTGRELKDSD